MLTASKVARALGVSKGRVYRALSRPYPLPYITIASAAKAGGQERHYTIGVLLPRLKATFGISPEQTKALFVEGGYNV
ncbi:hypothetical protein SAMN04488042_101736 [Shimia aestuarii]|uniref:Uncharacterized protein n=1 Tax=Shimia aestuarii TaxID=254406 RepID=A0A1I4ITA3_9RHOB|nr:hypothetical protein SAMN04488042_101736 [Shimia aestuarii]